MLAQYTADQLFRRLDHLDTGTKLTTPDGKLRVFEGKNPGVEAHLELYDWRVISNMVRKGDIGFAEEYRTGNWDTDNLIALTTIGLVNRRALDRFVAGSNVSRTIAMISYLLRLNSLKGSKKNIHAHYDLGNDFYKLWLDPSMTYSSPIKNDPKHSNKHNTINMIAF